MTDPILESLPPVDEPVPLYCPAFWRGLDPIPALPWWVRLLGLVVAVAWMAVLGWVAL